MIAALGHDLLFAGIALSGSIHAIAYMCLLGIFSLSLRPGKQPMISRFALFTRGHLADDLMIYTRQVTKVWCLFFAGQLLTSALVLTFAGPALWGLFVTIMNLPLIIAMLTVEYLYRLKRFPHYRHESLADMWRLFRHIRTARP